MSLRAALLEATQDPARLQRLAEGAATETAFVSRVLHELAPWLPVCQEPETLLSACEQHGWKRGGVTPGCVFSAPGVELGLVGRVSTDKSWVQAVRLASAGRTYRQGVGGMRLWVPPG